MEFLQEYKELMASLERMEKMNLATKGGPTGQLRTILAYHHEVMQECDAHISYLREEYDITKAQLEVAQNKINYFVKQYGQPVLRTYSKKHN